MEYELHTQAQELERKLSAFEQWKSLDYLEAQSELAELRSSLEQATAQEADYRRALEKKASQAADIKAEINERLKGKPLASFSTN